MPKLKQEKRRRDLISIIVPCYNEEESLPIFYDEVKKVSVNLYKKYNVNIEFIFINDGSKDATLDVLKKLRCV